MPLLQLAQQAPWRSMGSGLRGDRARFDAGDIAVGLLILAGVVVAIVVLSRLLSSQDRQRVFHSPRALFRSLCKAHGLDRSSRHLLWQVARWQRLTHPARLFLEPNRFEAVNLSPALQQKQAALTALRARIFAVSE